MANNKKIVAITGIRSDYDLMSPLYSLLHEDDGIDFKLVVSGAHMSPSYGYSLSQIKKDGFQILTKIESLIDADSKSSRLKSASIMLMNSIDIVREENPDVIIYAGDREDVIVGALLGGYLGIPTVHFYGGDHVQDSHIDNPVRHAASKLSTVHVVTLEEHKQRLIKMGEPNWRIHNFGSIALDRFSCYDPMAIDVIKEEFSIVEGFDSFALMIFHPIVEEEEMAHIYFEAILKTLIEKRVNTFVSYPNSDPGNKSIVEVIERYKTHPNFIFYKNLDRDVFLSVYKNADFIIGNSSSGVLEAASVPIPAINIGARQTSRVAGINVSFCKHDSVEVEAAISRAYDPEYLEEVRSMVNPYGDGDSAERAYCFLKENDLSAHLFKNEDPLVYE